jgi:hypothetical protein
LAAQQRLGPQVHFIVQRAFSIHGGVKLLSVHGVPPGCRLLGILQKKEAKGNFSPARLAAGH